jgi:flavodoxin
LRFDTDVLALNAVSLVCCFPILFIFHVHFRLCIRGTVYGRTPTDLLPQQRQLLQYSVVLIAISTTGQGELPQNSQLFWRALRSTRLRPGCLHKVRFASFGLGDTSYPK